MKFISAITKIEKSSLDKIRNNLEIFATLMSHPDTIDQVDFYNVKLRVLFRGKSSGFYIEVDTDLILREEKGRIQIIAYSNISKAMILSLVTAITIAIIFFLIYGIGSSLLSFLIVFPIIFIPLMQSIRRRASELLKWINPRD